MFAYWASSLEQRVKCSLFSLLICVKDRSAEPAISWYDMLFLLAKPDWPQYFFHHNAVRRARIT